jgi:hypothetical protein
VKFTVKERRDVMIDTVFMETEDFKIESFDVDKIERLRTIHDIKKNVRRYEGFFKNFKLRFWPNHISISGSLCQYYLGNNLQNMTRIDVRNAICQLSNELHLKIGEFDVYRLDIGRTFWMCKPVAYYLDELQGSPRYKVAIFPNETKYFFHDSKSVIFYDKRAQIRKKKKGFLHKLDQMGISESDHYMRFEVQLKKNVRGQLGLFRPLKASDLFDSDIFRKLVNFLKKEFYEIETTGNVLDFRQPDSFTPKALMRSLACVGMLTMGKDKILELVHRKYKENLIPRATYYKLLRKLNELQDEFCHVPSLWLEMMLDLEIFAATN